MNTDLSKEIKTMKTLTFPSGDVYEIVDQTARNNIEQLISDMSNGDATIAPENIKVQINGTTQFHGTLDEALRLLAAQSVNDVGDGYMEWRNEHPDALPIDYVDTLPVGDYTISDENNCWYYRKVGTNGTDWITEILYEDDGIMYLSVYANKRCIFKYGSDGAVNFYRNTGGVQITGVADPTQGMSAANKNYVDSKTRLDVSEAFATWVAAGNGSANVPRKYIETLADGDYRIVANGCEYVYHKITSGDNVWITEYQYPNDTVFYVSFWCNSVCAISISNDDGIIINDALMASQEYVDGEIAKVNNKISALDEQIATIETMNPSSWADVQKIVRAGLAPIHFPVGWEFETLDADTGASIVWVVRGHDHHIPGSINLTHSMTLEMKYVYSTANGSYKAIQFDASEALYYAQDGLEPGTYYFTVTNQDWFSSDNGKSYQFTLAKAVPAGGQICLDMTYNASLAGKSVKTYASPYATDAIETATLAESSEGAFLGTTDGSGNVNHMHRIVFGSNNYAQSAARQWLNSAAAAGGVWTPTNKFDRAPSWATSINGFLHGLPANFLEVVAPAIIPCRTCGVCECNSLDGTEFTVNQIYSLEDKFFLPSRPEIYGSWDSTSYKDGTLLDYYDGLTNAERQKYDNSGVARNAWLRSPFPSRGGNERIVPMESGVGNPAYASTGIAAACIIA